MKMAETYSFFTHVDIKATEAIHYRPRAPVIWCNYVLDTLRASHHSAQKMSVKLF